MPPRAKNADNDAETQENLWVAARIREARLLGGHHLKTIATRVGVTYQAYSRYEQGGPLTYGRLAQIARALDVSVEYLLQLADGLAARADIVRAHDRFAKEAGLLGLEFTAMGPIETKGDDTPETPAPTGRLRAI